MYGNGACGVGGWTSCGGEIGVWGVGRGHRLPVRAWWLGEAVDAVGRVIGDGVAAQRVQVGQAHGLADALE